MARRSGGTRRLAPLARNPAVVAGLLILWVAVFWGRSLGVGILSDGYFILAHASRGWPDALAWDGSYHYYPVTNAYFALLYRFFGLRAVGYQLVALLQLAAAGWLLYRMGRRLLGQGGWAVLGSLLLLGNSAFYEVPAWPVNGNLHTLAALLYLAGNLVLLRPVEPDRLTARGLVFGTVVLLAFLVYEPTITLVITGPALVILSRAGEDGEGLGRSLARRSSLRYLARLFWPAALAGVVAVGIKLWFLSRGAPVVNPVSDPWFGAFLVVRAVLALFTFTARNPLLYDLFSLGIDNQMGSPLMKGLVAGWVAALGLLAVVALWRLRRPAYRFLLLWLVVHLLLVSLVTGLAFRHLLLPALPAALLTAAAAMEVRRGLSRRISASRVGAVGKRGLARMVDALLGVGLLALLGLSWGHAGRAIDVHLRATAADRSIREAVRAGIAAHPDARRLLLVNMSSSLSGWGLGAFVFENGLLEQIGFQFPGRFEVVELGFTPRLGGVGKMANGSRLVPVRELRRKVVNPNWVVVIFDRLDGRARFVGEACW